MPGIKVIAVISTVCAVVGVCASGGDAYRIGSDDTLLMRSAQVKELDDKRFTVSKDGTIDLPIGGKVHAAGLPVPDLCQKLEEMLRQYYIAPRISVEIVEYRSQPVSVLGSVTNPGIYQLQGRKTLADVLSLAGGLKADAGYSVRISRKSGTGDGAAEEVRSYAVSDILRGGADGSVVVEARDVVTVPRAELIYVIGEVRKPGGFALGEKEHASVLQAFALAEGAVPTAALARSVILRASPGGGDRISIPVNLKKLIKGKTGDFRLQADDVLVVPSSNARKAALKTAEVALQTVSGVVIWRRP